MSSTIQRVQSTLIVGKEEFEKLYNSEICKYKTANNLVKELYDRRLITFDINKSPTFDDPFNTKVAIKASLNVVPPKLHYIVDNDYYTYRNNSFTKDEIDKALMNSYTERFI